MRLAFCAYFAQRLPGYETQGTLRRWRCCGTRRPAARRGCPARPSPRRCWPPRPSAARTAPGWVDSAAAGCPCLHLPQRPLHLCQLRSAGCSLEDVTPGLYTVDTLTQAASPDTPAKFPLSPHSSRQRLFDNSLRVSRCRAACAKHAAASRLMWELCTASSLIQLHVGVADVVLSGKGGQPDADWLSVSTSGAVFNSFALSCASVCATWCAQAAHGQVRHLSNSQLPPQVRELRTAQSSSPIDTLSQPFAKAKAQASMLQMLNRCCA
jgi:hypothetical protein